MAENVNSSNKYLLFTYGTLKRGQPNEHHMVDKATGDAKFVGTAVTIDKYPMVIGSKYNIPFFINSKGIGNVSVRT